MSGRVRKLLVLLAVVGLTACGVPGDGAPRVLEAKSIPGQLLEPVAEVTTTTQPSAFTDTTKVTIYLADADDRLVDVRRQVTSPATPAKALISLFNGPNAEEADSLSTAITSDTELLEVEGPTDGLVVLNLSRNLLDITGGQQILALAQVVFTVTSLPSVDRVLFEFEGERAEVPNGSGTLTASPLGRLSYRGLVRE